MGVFPYVASFILWQEWHSRIQLGIQRPCIDMACVPPFVNALPKAFSMVGRRRCRMLEMLRQSPRQDWLSMTEHRVGKPPRRATIVGLIPQLLSLEDDGTKSTCVGNATSALSSVSCKAWIYTCWPIFCLIFEWSSQGGFGPS